ncbi:MAG: 2-phosphosulfolactate phosphatase [Atopobiaceae bacterium]
MQVQILELIDGARKAQGLTVIIDVFRAFTLECYLFDQGAERIYPIGSVDDALAMKREHPDYVSFGERGGAQVDGFDFGNSPAQVRGVDLTGRTCIHTTSAGTQGIVNATGATQIVTASLVNASAVARYIRHCQPQQVSIVAMGNAGVRTAGEDVLCARYIKSILQGDPIDVQSEANALAQTDGAKFFDPAQPAFPQEDFPLCVDCDRFDFVIRVGHDSEGRLVNTKFDIR